MLSDNRLGNFGKRGTPDVNKDAAIVVQITGVISSAVTQLNAVPKVDLSGLDLTALGVAIYALLGVRIFAVFDIQITEYLFCLVDRVCPEHFG
ncbi:hypothetical protein OG21DRAFT_1517080 [Imleria badia]|nr:hypothetical protein OG21DRAFT_1517080 [Imleria badia]